MTPHFRFFTVGTNEVDQAFINKNCYGNGKYCAYETDNSRLPGREIVLEDLRQICIYNNAYNEKRRGTFWKYVHKVHS